jgi:hypothetical protein
MKKRISLIFLVLLSFGVTKTFATGIGIQGNYNAGDIFTPGPALTLKLDQTPFYFGINWNIDINYVNLGATADYWLINQNITNISGNPLNFHFGVGAFLNLGFGTVFNIGTGIRVPVGINMYLAQGRFEPFLEISPSFGLSFLPQLAIDRAFFPITFRV